MVEWEPVIIRFLEGEENALRLYLNNINVQYLNITNAKDIAPCWRSLYGKEWDDYRLFDCFQLLLETPACRIDAIVEWMKLLQTHQLQGILSLLKNICYYS